MWLVLSLAGPRERSSCALVWVLLCPPWPVSLYDPSGTRAQSGVLKLSADLATRGPDGRLVRIGLLTELADRLGFL